MKRIFIELSGDNFPAPQVGAEKRAQIKDIQDNDLLLVPSKDVPEDGVGVVLIEDFEASRGLLWLTINKDRLSASELSETITSLRKNGLSQREIATRTGLSEQDISFYVRLAASDPRITEALDSGRVSPSAVEPLLALSAEDQAKLVPSALQKKTARAIKALISAHKISQEPNTNVKETINEEIDAGAVLVLALLEEAYKTLDNASFVQASWSPTTSKTATQTLVKIKTLAERYIQNI